MEIVNVVKIKSIAVAMAAAIEESQAQSEQGYKTVQVSLGRFSPDVPTVGGTFYWSISVRKELGNTQSALRIGYTPLEWLLEQLLTERDKLFDQERGLEEDLEPPNNG